MIRTMERRVRKTEACPQCGGKCLCDRTKRLPQRDGSEMRIRYRYCTTCKTEDGSRVGIKETDWLE